MPRQMHTLMRQVLDAAQASRNGAPTYDPMLSEAGNRAARERDAKERKAALDGALAATFETASGTLAKEIFEKAAEYRPHFNRNDAAAAIITAQAWQFSVLPRLERGERLVDVLKTADTDAVLGAERFAPAYLSGPRGSGVLGEHHDASDEVARAVTARFIELADSPEAAAAIDEAEHFYEDLDTLMRTAQLIQRGDGASSIEAAALVAQSAAGPAAEADDAPAADAGDSAA